MPIPVKKHGELISKDIRDSVIQRFHTIVKTINREFWNSNSESDHGLLVGSYGRGTAIDDSDVDILVVLPKEEHERFDAQKGNGQSRLLQTLKETISNTYSQSDISADGQVVVMKFSDGMKIEVLPAFENYSWTSLNTSFSYPDTNMGGHWKSTNPIAEQKAMKEKNEASNGLLFDTCKHIRKIHLECFKSYKLPGILIDSFVYEAIKNWHWLRPNENESGGMTSYEQALLIYFNTITVNGMIELEIQAPGSGMTIDSSDSIECLEKILRKMAG